MTQVVAHIATYTDVLTYLQLYVCVCVYMVILKPDLVQLCTFFALFAGNTHSAIFLSFLAKIDFLIAVPQGWPQTCPAYLDLDWPGKEVTHAYR